MIKFGTGGWRCLTLASDSKCSNLAAAAAALITFRIDYFATVWFPLANRLGAVI